MRKIKFIFAFLLVMSLTDCYYVPAGHVGVLVYLHGRDKGVDHEVIGVGRHWTTWNTELHLFPTFKINKVWTADKRRHVCFC